MTAVCRSKAMQNDRLTAAEGEENRSSPQGRAEKAAADSENADGDRRKQELQKAQLPGNTGWLCLVFSVRFHPPADRLHKDRNYREFLDMIRELQYLRGFPMQNHR